MSEFHEVKCYQDRFTDILSNACKADIRYNDRNYQVNDLLKLREGYQTIGGFIFTGRFIICVITHVSAYGLKEGFVSLSIDPIFTRK